MGAERQEPHAPKEGAEPAPQAGGPAAAAALRRGRPLDAPAVLALQRTAGNQRTRALIARQQPPATATATAPPQAERVGFFHIPGTYEQMPTLAEAHDAVIRYRPSLAAALETARHSRAGEIDEFRDPAGQVVARVMRSVGGGQPTVGGAIRWTYAVFLELPESEGLRINTPSGGGGGGGGRAAPQAGAGRQAGAAPDPLMELYRKRFPAEAGSGPDRLTGAMKIRLALELADTSLWGEVGRAGMAAIRDPAFVGTTVALIGVYIGLWLTPDPTLLTKVAAGTLTAVMLSMFAWHDLWGFAQAWMRLSEEAPAATTPEALAAAGDRFLQKAGEVGFDILLILAFRAVDRVPGAAVRARARRRATVTAEAELRKAQEAPGAGGKVKATPERAGVLPAAESAAGAQAAPKAVLDALATRLSPRAQRGLQAMRGGRGGDAQALHALRGKQRGGDDIVRYLEEQGMSPAERTVAKDAVAEAHARLARLKLLELQTARDPAAARAVRTEMMRHLILVVRSLAGSSARVRDAIRANSVSDVVGALGEALARGLLRQSIAGRKNMEIRSDLEIAEHVPGYRTVGDWHRAEMQKWRAAGSQGKAPNPANMRTARGQVYRSVRQADNLVVERLPDGRLRIHVVEETKAGTDRPAEAKEQVTDFIEQLRKIAAGQSKARLFEKTGPQQLGADRTAQFDLRNLNDPNPANRPQGRTRGPAGKGFDESLGFDEKTLHDAAGRAIADGLPSAPAGPAPAIPQRDR